jgi:monoamine oxidase
MKGFEMQSKAFAEGFDLADINVASILSVKKEWQHEHDTQYRINGGYGQLTEKLYSTCLQKKAKILLKTECVKLIYKKHEVAVVTKGGKKITTRFVIITPSVAVLQSNGIVFDPTPIAHLEAIQQLGFGNIIKFILQFKSSFWEKQDEEIGFLLSDKIIPTWWTQLPVRNNILTGWIGGPVALQKSKETPAALLQLALRSLAGIFHTSTDFLKRQLLSYSISNWQKNKFVKGGYSYNTLYTSKAIEVLNKPIAETIWFAGEAYHDGESQGTVEAALQSGRSVAKKIIEKNK